MERSTLIIACLLAGLGGSVYAQAPGSSNDQITQMRNEQHEVDKAYAKKKKAIASSRDAKVKAAGDAAAADAKAKGEDPSVARHNAESNAKELAMADYDAKMKALKKEYNEAMNAIKKEYAGPAPDKATH